MHSNYIPQSSYRGSSRRHVQSNTPTRNRTRPTETRMHRRRLSNPASLGRPVTPTDHGVNQSFHTWTDSPRSLPHPHHPHAVPPEVVLGHSARASDQRSVVSEMGRSTDQHFHSTEEYEMPMDEAEDVMQRVSPGVLDKMRRQVEASQKEVERLTILLQRSKSSRPVDAADRGGGDAAAVMEDDVSSLGDDDHDTLKYDKIIQAIKEPRAPLDLSAEEKAVWDAVQSNMTKVRMEASNQRRELERQVHSTAAELKQVRLRERKYHAELEETAHELETLRQVIKAQKEDQSKSVDSQQVQKAAQAMKLRRLEDQLAETEAKYKEARELVESQQEEHDRAICAIQRVLADVTAERDKAIEELEAKLLQAVEDSKSGENLSAEGEGSPETSKRALQVERDMESLKSILQRTEKERDAVKHDLDQKGGNIVILEQELKVVKEAMNQSEAKEEEMAKKLEEKTQLVVKLEGELAAAKHQVETLSKRAEEMTAEADATKKEIYKLRRIQRHARVGGGDKDSSKGEHKDSDIGESEQVSKLKEQLEETQASLENAKKIILSLESASGTLAVDLRGKLKEKEDTVQSLQTEAAERKRALDSLGTELRDLQRRKSDMDHMDHWSRSHLRKQKVLAMQLEQSINELQEFAVVYESSMQNQGGNDQDTVDNISRLLANTLGALKYASIDVDEIGSMEKTASFDEDEIGPHGGSLRKEVEERKIQVNKLEESLKQYKDEIEAMRRESTQEQLKREEQETRLRSEILKLREQCRTNMEVLAKKERELEVLRDSLDVTDDGVGYISDDHSEDDEEDNAGDAATTMSSPAAYGHSQAQALATLMANGGIDSNQELEKLRKELKKAMQEKEITQKELTGERESLANAKMIISSLERANKSMMEDLRQRLQDSNTAIASLLDKSMQSEKQSTSLREELEKLRAERQEESEAHEAELENLREEARAQSMRLAAKDREIAELRASNQQDQESPAAEETKQQH